MAKSCEQGRKLGIDRKFRIGTTVTIGKNRSSRTESKENSAEFDDMVARIEDQE